MHCINISLIKKSDLRENKINNILDLENEELKYIDMGSDILAIVSDDTSKFRHLAKIKTDYFGGFGNQSAELFIDGKLEYSADDEYTPCKPINEVLRLMGVLRKDGMDEFDTIGLGNYRSYNDFQCIA